MEGQGDASKVVSVGGRIGRVVLEVVGVVVADEGATVAAFWGRLMFGEAYRSIEG